jgi:hypothetical protein
MWRRTIVDIKRLTINSSFGYLCVVARRGDFIARNRGNRV